MRGMRQDGAKKTQAVEAALRERVKELTCLYAIAQLAGRPGISLEALLVGIAKLVRRAWQYPEITSARIVLDGRHHEAPAFRSGPQRQTAELVVGGVTRGFIEVVYATAKPVLDEGPFLKEERSLINALAAQVAAIVQRREVEQDRLDLQNQLRHAERLATVGQLAAGMAHELNEPLGNILGFAQLALKTSGVPAQTRADIEKITAASLRARETIRKLLVFARQSPPQKSEVDLNQLVMDGLQLFKARCQKQGVDLELTLAPDLPGLTADPGQLTQVLVNLVVNALQAMPGPGRLKVETKACAKHVSLVVEDTGTGISQEMIPKLFVPFFTTKDVGEGTGLGLSVAHGIVASHHGKITVESVVDQGTRFEIQLPVAARRTAKRSRNQRRTPRASRE
jgi:two-component system NtrC family sensor kinase